jgi:hypothetical protein
MTTAKQDLVFRWLNRDSSRCSAQLSQRILKPVKPVEELAVNFQPSAFRSVPSSSRLLAVTVSSNE